MTNVSYKNSTQHSVLSTQSKTAAGPKERQPQDSSPAAQNDKPREQWLPVAAFLALTLPLALVEPVPSFVEATPGVIGPVPSMVNFKEERSQPGMAVPHENGSTVNNNSVPTAAADNLTPNAANATPQTAPVNKPAPLPGAAKHKSGRRILVSIPDRKLAVLEGGKIRKVYPVAVGAEVSPSPAGEFHIARKIAGPSYSHDGKVVAPGKGNPLGSRWMGLDKEHYGIHGTNVPESIGHAASHGCIRMRKPDVEELFEIASVGDVVEIQDTPTEELAQIFGTEATEANTSNGGEQ